MILQNNRPMQERLNQIIEKKGLTATKFAAMIGVNASTISHILAGRNKPGFDIINNIAKTFPDLNLTWLITGNGSMDNSPVQKEKSSVISEPTLFDMEPTKQQTASVTPDKNAELKKTRDPLASVGSFTQQTKKIKRIILFFEDGSFEDYEKE